MAPICCKKTMIINRRINRVSGPRVQYLCTLCGHSITVKENWKEGK